jgi:hypothetical protein
VARIEDLLREEFQRAAAAARERDAILARVARVRRRRVAAAGAGCAVVLAVAAALTVSRFGSTANQFGGATPPRDFSATFINAIFTDARHGYLAQERCSMDQVGDVP